MAELTSSFPSRQVFGGKRLSSLGLPCSSNKRPTRGVMAGLDLDNIVVIDFTDNEGESDGLEEEPQSTRRSRHTTRQAVHGRQPALYDGKYHPMDEYVGRKRRMQKVSVQSSDLERNSDTSDDEQHASMDDSDVESVHKGEDDDNSEQRTRRQMYASRYSARIATQQAASAKRPLYDQKSHPQDKALGIGRKRKKKASGRRSVTKRTKVESARGSVSGLNANRYSSVEEEEVELTEQATNDTILIRSPTASDSSSSDAEEDTELTLPYFDAGEDKAKESHIEGCGRLHDDTSSPSEIHNDMINTSDLGHNNAVAATHDDLHNLLHEFIHTRGSAAADADAEVVNTAETRADLLHNEDAQADYLALEDMETISDDNHHFQLENNVNGHNSPTEIQNVEFASKIDLLDSIENDMSAMASADLHKFLDMDAVDATNPITTALPPAPPSSAPSIGQTRYVDVYPRRPALRDYTLQVAQRDNATSTMPVSRSLLAAKPQMVASSGFTAINSSPQGPMAVVSATGQIRLLNTFDDSAMEVSASVSAKMPTTRKVVDDRTLASRA